LGVYGVPETFLVDPQGRIVFKRVGAVTPEILDDVILPMVATLRANPTRLGGDDAIAGRRR